jgi:hypothetical protein
VSSPEPNSPEPLLPSDYLVTQALLALDRQLPSSLPVMHIQVVGGYALQVNRIRTDVDEATDIDYIGQPLPDAVKERVNEVGVQFGLGSGWLNNDVLLSGNADVGSIELSTGPLRFRPLHIAGLTHFRVEVADPVSLLRMKLVAVDTQLTMFVDSRRMADFTRGKDLADIRLICEHENLNRATLGALVGEMSADGYLIEPDVTLRAAVMALDGYRDIEILERLLEK